MSECPQHLNPLHVSYVRVVVVDYTNSDDVGKQNSNGRIEDNKILVEFILLYMSVTTGYHSGSWPVETILCHIMAYR